RTFILRDRLLFKEVFTNFSIFVHAIRACSVNAILAVTASLTMILKSNHPLKKVRNNSLRKIKNLQR
ncbi:hypothetical protein L2095_25065, partial [Bacillus zanthoxyli]|nr:hypothetical protein [Bacillus zanthoxyli]